MCLPWPSCKNLWISMKWYAGQYVLCKILKLANDSQQILFWLAVFLKRKSLWNGLKITCLWRWNCPDLTTKLALSKCNSSILLNSRNIWCNSSFWLHKVFLQSNPILKLTRGLLRGSAEPSSQKWTHPEKCLFHATSIWLRSRNMKTTIIDYSHMVKKISKIQ